MPRTISYTVHPTPMKAGDTVQTYHARQSLKYTIRTRELAEHIARHALIDESVFYMVMERLKMELAEQLLSGHDLHLDGIGRFALQLGTRKVKNSEGKLVRKRYLKPDELTAHEMTIEGITFVPDKDMLDRLHGEDVSFRRIKETYRQEVSQSKLIGTLANYCQEHGSFSRRTVEHLFGISRYRAQQLLDKLVDGPTAKFYRERFGTSYVYRRFGT